MPPSGHAPSTDSVARAITLTILTNLTNNGQGGAVVRRGEQSINVAEAKKRLSDLLGRVAYGKETILIMRRGRPMARLIPPDEQAVAQGLAAVKGWLPDDDPFFTAVDEVLTGRVKHRPRVLPKSRARRKR